MPDLAFRITGIEPGANGLTPLLHFEMEVTNSPAPEKIQSALVQAQIQIQAPRRKYSDEEKEKLSDLFGAPESWGSTLRPKVWTITQTTVRAFTGTTTARLTLPCTFDLNVMAAKYFYALDGGDVPLLFLFSGSIFYEGPESRLQVAPISWNKECTYLMPVRTWRDLMEHHYPNTAWITLNRDVFERLYAFRRARGLATWDQTVEELLAHLLPTPETAEVPP